MDHAVPQNKSWEWRVILATWLLLALAQILLALPNRFVPGLYYDEAHCAGMARDFVTGQSHPHMADCTIVKLFGRPFPTFVQTYGGAVKSWMLIPIFAVFGASQAILRMTALGFGLIALLLFMRWTWRWLGTRVALLAGILLAFDPTYFFITVLDWGPVLPSFLCRFACFGFALSWWRLAGENAPSSKKILGRAFLAGFFAGLGFFNKIDFAVLLGGVLLALICCDARSLWTRLMLRRPVGLILCAAGFLIAAGPILPHLFQIVNTLPAAGQAGSLMADFNEKVNVTRSMYDGSYFYRLMAAGGRFTEMFKSDAPVFVPLGLAVLVAAAGLVFRSSPRDFLREPAGFLILALLFITTGVFLLPRATRIHHMVLAYPFPHLVVALALDQFWRRRWVVLLFVLLVASQIFALGKTQQSILKTGGRGWWSDSLMAFAREVRDRPDLTLVSEDWGFNEQLAFLTDGPKLDEPFWRQAPSMPRLTNYIYLVHPPQYSLFRYGPVMLQYAKDLGTNAVDIKTWRDHQGQVAFYSIQFRTPPAAP